MNDASILSVFIVILPEDQPAKVSAEYLRKTRRKAVVLLAIMGGERQVFDYCPQGSSLFATDGDGDPGPFGESCMASTRKRGLSALRHQL
jgi:hypothetical protein